MRFSTYCTHTHTHIWGYTYRCSYAYERHSLSGCAEFSTRKQTNSFDKPKGAPGEPTEEEESNRTEPNWRTKVDRAEDSRKTTTKQPDVFSQTDGTEKPNWTELEKENSARSVRRSAQCAVRQTNRQADEQTNRKAERERGGGRTERPGTVARPWRTRESLLRGSLSVLSRRRAESNK